jgi:hypothetical protein
VSGNLSGGAQVASEPETENVMQAAATDPDYRMNRLFHFLFVLFCLELGLFLVVFPWTRFWDFNYISTVGMGWQHIWGNSYVRGAVSGLGVFNLLICFEELIRLMQRR